MNLYNMTDTFIPYGSYEIWVLMSSEPPGELGFFPERLNPRKVESRESTS